MVGTRVEAVRDHLFISYATEDAPFVDWLALKLTTEGYKVWYDRAKLLGGESYPRDIDRAIAEATFRVLAIISRSSISKPNPMKERTHALNIGKKLGADFLLPLKIDNLATDELGFQLSDLTHISFDGNWAQGLAQLVKGLEASKAPRDQAEGRAQVSAYLNVKDCLKATPERVWTNLLPIEELPRFIHRFRAPSPESVRETDKVWPISVADERSYWTFVAPEVGLGILAQATGQKVDWRGAEGKDREGLSRVVAILVRRTVELDCMRRGLSYNAEDQLLYFGHGRFPSDRLTFKGWDGKGTWLQVTGERTRGRPDGSRLVTNYAIAFQIRPSLTHYGTPLLRILPTVRLTSVDGVPVSGVGSNRARKSVTKSWWNHEWLSRVMAIASWLSEAKESRVLARTSEGNLTIGGSLLTTTSSMGIDESALGPEPERPEIEDDDEDDGEGGADPTTPADPPAPTEG